MTRQTRLRWIFMIGVLAGLFFSSGEGVQLLPFPIAEAGNLQNASSALEKNPKSYALSVNNSGNHSNSLRFKLQKQDDQNAAVGLISFEWMNVRDKLLLKSARHSKAPPFSHTTVFLISLSDRAPPIA